MRTNEALQACSIREFEYVVHHDIWNFEPNQRERTRRKFIEIEVRESVFRDVAFYD